MVNVPWCFDCDQPECGRSILDCPEYIRLHPKKEAMTTQTDAELRAAKAGYERAERVMFDEGTLKVLVPWDHAVPKARMLHIEIARAVLATVASPPSPPSDQSRTPGTVEVCAHTNCDMSPEEARACEHLNCPIRHTQGGQAMTHPTPTAPRDEELRELATAVISEITRGLSPSDSFILCIARALLSRLPGEGVDGLSFSVMRKANVTRCKRWHPGGVSDWSLSDWMTATTGELGEAANIVKKLNRCRDGLIGNKESEAELRAMLAHEIADVAIYLDIFAEAAGVDLGDAIIDKFNIVSVRNGFPDRLPTPAHPPAVSRDEVVEECARVADMANQLGNDLSDEYLRRDIGMATFIAEKIRALKSAPPTGQEEASNV